MSRFWNFIVNEQDSNEIELRISGEIVSDDDAWLYEWFGIPAASSNAFRNELAEYKGKNITVWIDSGGGDYFAGVGMYTALMEHKRSGGKVIAKIIKAMSAATMPAMAADEVHISPPGMMMIHNPISRVDWGEAKDMRHAANVLDEVTESIINAYQMKTGKSRKKISEMMDNETYMSAKTAIKEGFADKVLYTETSDSLDSEPIENNFMFSRMAIYNSMDISMKKFFNMAKKYKNSQEIQSQSSQPTAHEPHQAVTNINQDQKGAETMPFKTVEELKNTCPELVQQIENAAREEGRKEERTRLQNIDEISQNLDPELVNKAKYVEPMNAEKLAFEAVKADKNKGQQYINNAQADINASGANNIGAAPVSVNNDAEKPKTIGDKFKNIAAQFDARRRGVNE